MVPVLRHGRQHQHRDLRLAQQRGGNAAKNGVRNGVAAVPANKGREAFVEETFKLYNAYVYPGQTVLGAMDRERLAALQKFYVEQGIVQKESPVAELFTNEFLP